MRHERKIAGSVSLFALFLSLVLRCTGHSLHEACCGSRTFVYGGALWFLGGSLRELAFGIAHFVVMIAGPVFLVAVMTARLERWVRSSLTALCLVSGWTLSGYWVWHLVCAG